MDFSYGRDTLQEEPRSVLANTALYHLFRILAFCLVLLAGCGNGPETRHFHSIEGVALGQKRSEVAKLLDTKGSPSGREFVYDLPSNSAVWIGFDQDNVSHICGYQLESDGKRILGYQASEKELLQILGDPKEVAEKPARWIYPDKRLMVVLTQGSQKTALRFVHSRGVSRESTAKRYILFSTPRELSTRSIHL